MPTVKEAALAWWEEKQKTIFPYEHVYYIEFFNLYILRFLGDEEISQLTASRIDAYFAQLLFEQTYRNSIRRNQVAYGKPILQSIFDFAIERGMAESLPKAELTFRINLGIHANPAGCDYTLETIEQIKKMINCERGSLVGIALGLAWYAGFTREEILSLKWGDIDLVNKLISHEDGRQIYMEEPLCELFLFYLEKNRGSNYEYIFISNRNTRFSGPSLSGQIKKAKEKYGFSDAVVTLNALRNNYTLRKLNSILTEELPSFTQGMGVSPISMLNVFGYYLAPTENKAKGVVNGLYNKNRNYWMAQLARQGLDGTSADALLNAFSKIITSTLAKGEPVGIEGFGVFYIKSFAGRYERDIFSLEFNKVEEEHELEFLSYPNLLFEINFATNM